jgi:uncharacterized repeat protein (TIGR01451 family)
VTQCGAGLLALAALFAAIGAARAAPPTVGGCQVFPANNYWNTPVDTLPLHPSSASWVASVGNTARLHADWGSNLADNYGIPFVTVTAAQPLVQILLNVDESYPGESDPGPYPIPPNAPIEGGPASTGDRHVLVIETTNCVLYELYRTYPAANNDWSATSYAKYPLASNALRPAGWTSADAAGLPIFPGLVRWEEVAAGEINHAIRFTANLIWGRENGAPKYLWPARHWSGSSTDSARPPMGARFRLKASFDVSGYSAATQVILRAFKKYGLVLADAGSNWYFQGVSDANWPDAVFSELGGIAGSNFEVVDTSVMQVNPDSAQSVVPGLDLAVSQTASPNPGAAGKDIVYQVTVSNGGAAAASDVVLTNALPAGSTFIWASAGCGHAAGIVTCNLASVAGGASVVRKVVVRPASPGTATNNASVTTSGSDPVPGNNANALGVTVNSTPVAAQVLRYRLYSDVTKEHHFTTDQNEYNVLGTYVGTWVQEGTVGKVLDNPGSFGGVAAVPYYRLYDTATRWHHWTTDANEYYTLIQFPNWNAEGVDGYILPTNTIGATQLYRLLYPFVAGLHHWTIDANEYNTLINSYGWIGEGGAGFVIQ